MSGAKPSTTRAAGAAPGRPAAAIELTGVSRRFGAVEAVRAVSLRVEVGAVHAVVGENGAGKSTLVKIAYGEVRADAGRIALGGEIMPIARHDPAAAIRRGVGMVHQHFMLVGPLTVTENLVLGREPTRRGVLDLARAARELGALAARHGLAVDPAARVDELSVGEQQRVEILRVLWQGARTLILDEPTGVLTPGEVRDLFAVLRNLVAGGATVVLVTHKLDEVVDLADRVTVLRRGEVVAQMERGDGLSTEAIAHAMVGRAVLFRVDKGPAQPGADLLEVDDLHVTGRGGRDAVRGVSLVVRAGEIVGVAGVEGNGQSELVEAVTGLRRARHGRIRLAGVDVTAADVRTRRDAGCAHVPEDRRVRGLVLPFSVAENLAFGRERELSGRFGFDPGKVRAHAAEVIADLGIQPEDPALPAAALSGGNQQKVVVGRELGQPGLRVLVCAQPTRGVDVGAIELIHRRIIAARDAGAAVLLVSSELAEIRSLADRAVVLFRGQVAGELDAGALAAADAPDRLGALMTGAVPPGAA